MELLDSPDAIAAYIEAAFEDGNPTLQTLTSVMKALGMKLSAQVETAP